MRNFLRLLAGALIFVFSNCAFTQQESAQTVTSINQKLIELKAIRIEGLITEVEYKKKEQQLRRSLKKLSQTNPTNEPSVKATVNEVVPNNHQQSKTIPDNVAPANSTELSSKLVQPLTPPTEVKAPLAQIVVPPNPKAIEWNDKSFASANLGEWADAIRTASVAISLDQNYVLSYINRCRAYLGHGNTDEAMQDCDTALKLDPHSMLAINNRGAILARQGKQDAALAEYEKACFGGLEIGCDNFRKIRGYSPNDTAALAKIKLDKAQTKFSEKNWDGAIAISTEAINLMPSNAAPYVTRSGAYANTGRLPESLADSETAIRLNPDEGMAYNNRGYVNELMKNPRQASLDYEIACGLKVELGCINLKRINH